MLKKRSPVYSQSKLFLTCIADILITESILSGLVHWTMCAHSVDIVHYAEQLVSSFLRSGDAATSNNLCSFKFSSTKRYGLLRRSHQ